jgi:hypothetical protein
VDEIVRGREEVVVATVEDDLSLGESRVVGWHKNPRNGRKFVRVEFEGQGMARGSCKNGAVVTEDHPFLTRRGWVSAGELAPSDEVCTGTPMPNETQLPLVVGMLLGDGSITGVGQFRVEHCKSSQSGVASRRGYWSPWGLSALLGPEAQKRSIYPVYRSFVSSAQCSTGGMESGFSPELVRNSLGSGF